ncbi:MAG TPA: protein kinase [Gemmataceae bacterium]|nr:protein kinase [Gemmataceae bacterium]
MAAPSNNEEFLDLVRKSAVVESKRLDAYLEKIRAAGSLPATPAKLAGILVRDGILTHFQAEQFLQGRWRRFTIGKYKVLERIGTGGMGSVYLCEHKFMRRRAAVKVLPTAKASDPASLERFYREARAVAALDHPNIVRAYDIDQDDNLHFLVMEYVDGSSLQELVKKVGPLGPIRSAHYISQSALGLQHAHEAAGLVHRDIKPGNLLVDRTGTVKVLDMGLARFFNDEEDLLTKKYDENVLGTADYLAPEQALDSHSVDIRADIYSLGATFYFCLTGRTPFSEGTVAQKLIWHQTRQPKPIRALQPAVPEAMAAIIEKMMAKDPAHRYQTPLEVAEALAPWTETPIAPPDTKEMPQLSPAASPASTVEASAVSKAGPRTPPPGPATPAPAPSKPRRNWDLPGKPTAPPPSKGLPPSFQAKEPIAAPSVSAPVALSAQPKPFENLGAPPKVVAAPKGQTGPGDNGAPKKPAPQPAEDEESLPWEKLAPDTQEMSAMSDTLPRSPRKPPTKRQPPRKQLPWDNLTHQQLIWISAIVGGVIFALAVIAIWLWPGPSRDEIKPSPPKPPSHLLVNKAGRTNEFTSVDSALARARPGDHIVITDDMIEEQLTLNRKFDVTIEAPPGKLVEWRFPEAGGAGNHLLHVSGVRGLKLKGIAFDGRNKVDEIIEISGNCPDLRMEDLRLKGFKRYGIVFANCAGTSAKPVILRNLQINNTETVKEAALAFTVLPNIADPRVNEHIQVLNCQFNGAFRTPVVANASAFQSVTFDPEMAVAPPLPPPAKPPAKPPEKKPAEKPPAGKPPAQK